MAMEEKELYKINFTRVVRSNDITEIKANWILSKNIDDLLLENPRMRDLCTNRNEMGDFDEDHKFQLRIKVFGTDKNSIEFYYLAAKPVYLTCKLWRRGEYSRDRICISSGGEFKWIEANRWQCLYNENRSNISITSLEYEFMIKNIKSDSETLHNIKLNNKAKLNCDVEYLLNNPKYSDVTIKSNKGVEIYAHKGILATRSPVFKAHFDHEMVENVTNVVESPFETEELQAALMYVYTANIPKLNEIPEKLFKVADFYQLNELKIQCEEALREKLTIDNVIKTLELANLYSARNLKDSCLRFINDNDAVKLIQTEDWQEISHELLKSIAEYIIVHGFNI